MSDPAPPAPPARLRRLAAPALVAGLLLVGFGAGLRGDRIPVSSGLGYDGRESYVHQATRFFAAARRLPRWRLQRCLPGLVVFLGATVAGAQPLDDAGVVLGFALLNLALLALGLVLWQGVLDALRLSERARWLAWGGLFLSFAGLKMPFYAPVLTDTAGLVLTIGALLAFLRRARVALALVLLLAAFTWPPLAWSGAVLLVLPRRDGEHAPASRPAGVALALLVAAAATAAALRGAVLVDSPAHLSTGALAVHLPTLPLSLACLGGYLALVGKRLLGECPLATPAALRAQLSLPELLLVPAALLGLQLLLRALPLAPGPGLVDALVLSPGSSLVHGVRLPLVFLVAHVVYFGPVVLVAAAYFGGVCAAAWSLGLGLTIYVWFGLVTGVNSESRHLLHVWPVVVALTAMAVERRGIGWPVLGLVLAVGAASSQLWLPMGHPGALSHYLRLHGPWMDPGTYAVGGLAAVALLGVVLWQAPRGAPAE
ncbi:MAG: hypothetical protein KF878_32990 [Planctomycetes bacterium]|nr:hypothetical protein [Planctomycetota bacterium]